MSKRRIGARSEAAQEFAPHRSATQTLVPDGSMATPADDPQVRPSGIRAQFSTERYGLGSELIGAAGWAVAWLIPWAWLRNTGVRTDVAMSAKTASPSRYSTRAGCRISCPPFHVLPCRP